MNPTATLPLRDANGAAVGSLSIVALPRSRAPQNCSENPARSRHEPAIQLQEASSYRYEVDLAGVHEVDMEPAELFDPDDPSGITGRLHTRQYVGDVWLTALDAQGSELGSAPVLVKAAKLTHEHEYRRMLRDIADQAAEAVLQGFAPSSLTTSIAPSKPARLLYQQFAILQARLADEELQEAIAEVIHRPQQDWIRETESRPPGRPIKVGGDVGRALTGPGSRVQAATPIGLLHTLPSTIESHRSEETVDTVANRFVKFALRHWRELATRLAEILGTRASVAYGVRGAAAVDRVIEALDDVLSEPFFRQIGELHELPTSNQVLLKREGYRQIFSTFALVESSLDLRIDLDDAIHPSQRNIASLYEYWTFLKLVEVLGAACGDARAPLKLFEQDGDGLSLGLRRGKESKLRWDVPVAGRRLAVTVYFNRTFRAAGTLSNDGSWSRPMVPDASVLIRPSESRARVESERDLDVWLHFDAKYKLDWSPSQFEKVLPEQEQEIALREEEQERVGSSRRDDLLKMHAYRDAIRRSAGAYVMFPGTSEALEFREYVELIPGLGAFPLRPGSDGGPAALRRFIDDVLLHAADQATAEERNRFWRARVFHESSRSGQERTVGFLDRPPADTPVLLAHVQDEQHWRWSEETGQYVVRLRAEPEGITFRAEELAAPLVLLSGRGRAVIFERRGAWSVVDDQDLRAFSYPSPWDGPGLLCRLIQIREQPTWLSALPAIDLLARSRVAGEPVLTYWSTLVGREPQPVSRGLFPTIGSQGRESRKRAGEPTVSSAGASSSETEPTDPGAPRSARK